MCSAYCTALCQVIEMIEVNMPSKTLLKSEYISVFDKLMSEFENKIGYKCEIERMPLLTDEEIIGLRKEFVGAGCNKYGPMCMNYIDDKLMKPLEDIEIRVNYYENTHNVEYLIDAINFCMYAYRQKTKKNYTCTEFEVFEVMLSDAIEYINLKQSIQDLINGYLDEKDLGYLLVIALLLKYEIQYPIYHDAFFERVTEKTDIAGICYYDIHPAKEIYN